MNFGIGRKKTENMSQEKDSPGTFNPAFDAEEVNGGENSEQRKIDVGSEDLNDGPTPKIPYPKSVFFIVVTELCERFTFYGLRTVLSLYLSYELNYDNDSSTVIYHIFIMFCYFFPILGAILADSWLGKFRTIFYLSIVYALGSVIVSVAATPDLIPPRAFTMIGLLLIALGTGGIKPCVSAFGGDQFVLPQQEDQLQKFFSLFYFSINSGSFLSTLITPILREDVKCFGKDSCFPLAFGVPAILMITGLVIFAAGKRWYKIKDPEGNILVKVSKCMWYASRKKDVEKREHWLYKADDKYDRKFIQDIVATLRVLVLYIPLPIFWALFDQQGSRWTFQASRMDVDVAGIRIKPDQMQVVNPILILLFIPLFESVVYPLFAKCNLLKRPLQRLTVGGLLAAAAFGVSALVEMKLETTYPELPQSGEGQLRLINAYKDTVNFDVEIAGKKQDVDLPPNGIFKELHIKTDNSTEISIKYSKTGKEYTKKILEQKASTFFFRGFEADLVEVVHGSIDKSKEGDPKMMIFIANDFQGEKKINISTKSVSFAYTFNSSTPFMDFKKIPTDNYTVKLDEQEIGYIFLKQGGIYSLMVTNNGNSYETNLLTITPPNSMCILWLLPQYVIITAGEIMFSVTGLEFSFTQAPVSMKSLMQAAWLFTVGIGNLVVVIVAEAKIFSRQMFEFLLFGGLMVLNMLIFALMAMRYTYVEDLVKEDGTGIEFVPVKSKESKD